VLSCAFEPSLIIFVPESIEHHLGLESTFTANQDNVNVLFATLKKLKLSDFAFKFSSIFHWEVFDILCEFFIQFNHLLTAVNDLHFTEILLVSERFKRNDYFTAVNKQSFFRLCFQLKVLLLFLLWSELSFLLILVVFFRSSFDSFRSFKDSDILNAVQAAPERGDVGTLVFINGVVADD